MWYQESIFYQIYALGFLNAPEKNDGRLVKRIEKLTDWIPHMKEIGINALYLCPIFESDAHGYDTKDYRKIDHRLGSNEDFKKVCEELHDADIRIVLDGVFNHVGRGFWAFEDLLQKREASAYKDWFFIDFNGNSCYNDGFAYQGWEGHFNLVKLNLYNPEVREHLFSCIKSWVEEFQIDGLRLDVAYLLEEDFLRHLHHYCKSLKEDFFLVGETIHGDYNRIVNAQMLDSCTNYECFKGIYSSFANNNMFEIAYSINRQFGPENWSLYKGLPLFNFLDNHDVSRIASNLNEERHLPAAYALLFAMPGIPCIYYGSEWGEPGVKGHGSDTNLRPYFEKPKSNKLTNWIAALSNIYKSHPAMAYGDYRQLYLTNQQFVFVRNYEDDTIIVAINIDSAEHQAYLPRSGSLTNLLNQETITCDGSLILPAYSAVLYGEV